MCNDAPEITDPDEELVSQCLDLFLTQLGTGRRAIELNILENSAPSRVRQRIQRAKECVEMLELLAAIALEGSLEIGQCRSSATIAHQNRFGRFEVLDELG